MRPPARHFGALAQPLDELLGTPARVRVLRALDRIERPLTVAALAQEASLTHNATRQALTRFTESGLVDESTAGRHRLYRASTTHPFAAGLSALFAAERERRRAIQTAVEAWADAQPGALRAVWLFGSVARQEDGFGSDVDLALVADGREDARHFAASLTDTLAPVARRYQLYPNVLAYDAAEALTLPERAPDMWANLARDAVPLHGPGATALHRQLAQWADRHPGLAARAAALRAEDAPATP